MELNSRYTPKFFIGVEMNSLFPRKINFGGDRVQISNKFPKIKNQQNPKFSKKFQSFQKYFRISKKSVTQGGHRTLSKRFFGGITNFESSLFRKFFKFFSEFFSKKKLKIFFIWRFGHIKVAHILISHEKTHFLTPKIFWGSKNQNPRRFFKKIPKNSKKTVHTVSSLNLI